MFRWASAVLALAGTVRALPSALDVVGVGDLTDATNTVSVDWTHTSTVEETATVTFTAEACDNYKHTDPLCEDVPVETQLNDYTIPVGTDVQHNTVITLAQRPSHQYLYIRVMVALDAILDIHSDSNWQPAQVCPMFGPSDSASGCRAEAKAGEDRFYMLSSINHVLTVVPHNLDMSYRVDCPDVEYEFHTGASSTATAPGRTIDECKIEVLENGFTVRPGVLQLPQMGVEYNHIRYRYPTPKAELAYPRLQDSHTDLWATVRVKGKAIENTRAVVIQENEVTNFVELPRNGAWPVLLQRNTTNTTGLITATLLTETINEPEHYVLDVYPAQQVVNQVNNTLTDGQYCLLGLTECHKPIDGSLIDGWAVRVQQVFLDPNLRNGIIEMYVQFDDPDVGVTMRPSLAFVEGGNATANVSIGSVDFATGVAPVVARLNYGSEGGGFGKSLLAFDMHMCLDVNCTVWTESLAPGSERFQIDFREMKVPSYQTRIGSPYPVMVDNAVFTALMSEGKMRLTVSVTNFDDAQARTVEVRCTGPNDPVLIRRPIMLDHAERRVLHFDFEAGLTAASRLFDCTVYMPLMPNYANWQQPPVEVSSVDIVCGPDRAYDRDLEKCYSAPGHGYPDPFLEPRIGFNTDFYITNVDEHKFELEAKFSHKHKYLIGAGLRLKSCCMRTRAPHREPFGDEPVIEGGCDLLLDEETGVFTLPNGTRVESPGGDMFDEFVVKGHEGEIDRVLVSVDPSDGIEESARYSKFQVRVNLLEYHGGSCHFEVSNGFDEPLRPVTLTWNSTDLRKNFLATSQPTDSFTVDYFDYVLGHPKVLNGRDLVVTEISIGSRFRLGEFARFVTECLVDNSLENKANETHNFVGRWFPVGGMGRNYVSNTATSSHLELPGMAYSHGECVVRLQVREKVLPQEIKLPLFAYSCGDHAFMDVNRNFGRSHKSCKTTYLSIQELMKPTNCIHGRPFSGACICDYQYESDPRKAHREEGNEWCTEFVPREGDDLSAGGGPGTVADSDALQAASLGGEPAAQTTRGAGAFLAIVIAILGTSVLVLAVCIWRSYKLRQRRQRKSKDTALEAESPDADDEFPTLDSLDMPITVESPRSQ